MCRSPRPRQQLVSSDRPLRGTGARTPSTYSVCWTRVSVVRVLFAAPLYTYTIYTYLRMCHLTSHQPSASSASPLCASKREKGALCGSTLTCNSSSRAAVAVAAAAAPRAGERQRERERRLLLPSFLPSFLIRTNIIGTTCV